MPTGTDQHSDNPGNLRCYPEQPNNVQKCEILVVYADLTIFVTQCQLMRLFVVKSIVSYGQKCKVRSKFLKS